MNKHELRSAYNKIALSDEFKASAKEKLLASYDDNTASDESVQELHTAKELKLPPQPKKQPWKIAVGACAAAAAVGIGVWGVSSAIGRDMPISDTSGANTQASDTTSVSTTAHTADSDPVEDISDDAKRTERIKRYDTENPVNVFEGTLRNGSSKYDFAAYIYQMMSETEDAYRGNCAIEITENGEVVDRNMLLVGYTLGQNGTEFLKDGENGCFSVIELQNGSLLLSTREQDAVTEATLYTVKGNRIAQIERYFENPAEKPEKDSSIRSFNLSRSYTTEKDDIIFNIGGEDVRVTIDFDELTLKCEDGFEGMVYCGYDAEDGYQATVDANYGEVRMLFDYYNKDTMPWDEETAFYIEGFPEVQFIWDHENIKAVDKSGNEELLFEGMPIWSVYLTDLNGDGLREICSGMSIGSGIVDDRVAAYDYAAKKLYDLSDRGYHDYYLSYTGIAPLMVYERDYASGELTGYCGALKLDGDKLTFERGGDINTAETNQYTLPVTIMTQSEHGGLTFPQDEEISAEVAFSLPSSWECSASTASYAYAKVFEIGGVWRAYEGINTDSYKTDEAYGATITVIEEKHGTKNDLYEYFIHTSMPIKYAPDGTYDVYRYVVESNGYYVTVSVMSDMGVSQETIDRVLKSVEINADAENEVVDGKFEGWTYLGLSNGTVWNTIDNGKEIDENDFPEQHISLFKVEEGYMVGGLTLDKAAVEFHSGYSGTGITINAEFSGQITLDGYFYIFPADEGYEEKGDIFFLVSDGEWNNMPYANTVSTYSHWWTENDFHWIANAPILRLGNIDDYDFDLSFIKTDGDVVHASVVLDGLEVTDGNYVSKIYKSNIIDAKPINYDKPLDINYTDTVLWYRSSRVLGEIPTDEYDPVLDSMTILEIDVELPLGWRLENGEKPMTGTAYYNDNEIFSYEHPIKESEGIDTAMLLSRTTEGEEKYGGNGDLFEYRLITPTEYIYVVNSGGYNVTLTFAADAGLDQTTINMVLGSVVIREYEKTLTGDGYSPIGGVGTLVHNGVEYSQDILTYRFVMDKYCNILEDDPENYNNINDYLGALKNSTYIGTAEKLCWTGEDMRYYFINDDVILGITLCGKELHSYVDAEELLEKYTADEIFHAYIYERIKG